MMEVLSIIMFEGLKADNYENNSLFLGHQSFVAKLFNWLWKLETTLHEYICIVLD